MPKYQYIQDIVDYINNKQLADQVVGYSGDEIARIENMIPKGKKIPEAVREWLLFVGNYSLELFEFCSFERLRPIWQPDGSLYGGDWDSNFQKMLKDYFPFCFDEEMEDYIDLYVVRYDEGEDPPIYHWIQNFTGKVEILNQWETLPKTKRFSSYIDFL